MSLSALPTLTFLLSTVQSDASEDYVKEWWCCSAGRSRRFSVIKHEHHRLALDVPGYSLGEFDNAKELFGAGLDVLNSEFCVRIFGVVG